MVFRKNYRGNFSGDNGPNGGYNNNRSQSAGGRNFSDVVCQICFIPGHGANRCKNRFNPSFVPQKNFGRGNFRGQYGRGRSFNGFGRGSMFPGPHFRSNFGNSYMPRGVAFQANMAYSDPTIVYGYAPLKLMDSHHMHLVSLMECLVLQLHQISHTVLQILRLLKIPYSILTVEPQIISQMI